GDQIDFGQSMAIFDGREMQIELEQIRTEIAQQKGIHAGYLAQHNAHAANVAILEMQRLQAKERLVQQRLDQLIVNAPIEGVVLASPFANCEELPIRKGEVIFELAPIDGLEFELLIPQAEIRHCEVGMKCVLKLEAYPGSSWTGQISKISPTSEIRGKRNGFVAKVAVSEGPSIDRPGLCGSASIEAPPHPVAWNYLHRAVERVLRWIGF
ncbi:MAG: HlyD family secretion protein, partial [Planctomycetota bacterium]